MFVSTKQARAILKRTVNLSDFVWQTANLAGFISGCYTNDLDMIRDSFEDVVIEPQRQLLIPGFTDVSNARRCRPARSGCSISGAGPDDVRLGLEADAAGGARGDGRASSRAQSSRSTTGSSPVQSRARAW